MNDHTDRAALGQGPAARLQHLFEGHRLTPTQRRIAHCMVAPRGRRAVPVLGGAGGSGPSQPAVRDPFAVALGSDELSGAAQAPARGRPRQRRTAATEASEYQQAVEAEIANLRHLAGAARRPVDRSSGRAGCSPRPGRCRCSACAPRPPRRTGFSYFAAKVHPDVRLLDEAARCSPTRIDAAVRAGRGDAALLRAPPPSAGGRRAPSRTPRRPG